jgi:hypothetical protein
MSNFATPKKQQLAEDIHTVKCVIRDLVDQGVCEQSILDRIRCITPLTLRRKRMLIVEGFQTKGQLELPLSY